MELARIDPRKAFGPTYHIELFAQVVPGFPILSRDGPLLAKIGKHIIIGFPAKVDAGCTFAKKAAISNKCFSSFAIGDASRVTAELNTGQLLRAILARALSPSLCFNLRCCGGHRSADFVFRRGCRDTVVQSTLYLASADSGCCSPHVCGG